MSLPDPIYREMFGLTWVKIGGHNIDGTSDIVDEHRSDVIDALKILEQEAK